MYCGTKKLVEGEEYCIYESQLSCISNPTGLGVYAELIKV